MAVGTRTAPVRSANQHGVNLPWRPSRRTYRKNVRALLFEVPHYVEKPHPGQRLQLQSVRGKGEVPGSPATGSCGISGFRSLQSLKPRRISLCIYAHRPCLIRDMGVRGRQAAIFQDLFPRVNKGMPKIGCQVLGNRLNCAYPL